jgi:tight adherence protein C
MITLIVLSTFVFVILGVMAVYWLMVRPQSAAAVRLEQLGQTGGGYSGPSVAITPEQYDPVSAFAEKVAAPLSKIAPPSAMEAQKLQRQLMHAGYRSSNAVIVYRAIQLCALFGLPLIVAAGSIVLAKPLDKTLIFILLAFVIGFFMPRFFLQRSIKKRQLLIQWGLADALDLMVVSIEAGLGLNAALVRVSEELKKVHTALSEEFELTNLEIRMGRERDESLRNLAERTGVDDLRSLVAMLIQTDRFGTSIAKAIRVFSDSMRTKRRQRAEQAAQKAAVKLLFPLACFLFPTLFIILIGPAMINLMDTFANM